MTETLAFGAVVLGSLAFAGLVPPAMLGIWAAATVGSEMVIEGAHVRSHHTKSSVRDMAEASLIRMSNEVGRFLGPLSRRDFSCMLVRFDVLGTGEWLPMEKKFARAKFALFSAMAPALVPAWGVAVTHVSCQERVRYMDCPGACSMSCTQNHLPCGFHRASATSRAPRCYTMSIPRTHVQACHPDMRKPPHGHRILSVKPSWPEAARTCREYRIKKIQLWSESSDRHHCAIRFLSLQCPFQVRPDVGYALLRRLVPNYELEYKTNQG